MKDPATDSQLNLMVTEGSIFADPRLCPWCSGPYIVQEAVSARVQLSGGDWWTCEGTGITLARCERDGVFVIS